MAQKNAEASGASIAEEMALLRQKFSSLALRGRYAECARLIEDNLKLMYVNEYWPENFFSMLRTYQRCYPALNRSESLEERLKALLEKNGIPFIFATFFRPGGAPARWGAEQFRDRALKSRAEKDYETALANCELALKIDPASTNLSLLCGWIYEDMGRDSDAISMYERAFELNESNIKASQGIARLYAKSNLAKALEYVDKAITANPDEAGLYAEKSAILLAQGKRPEAMATLEKASDTDPYNPEYPYRKAEILISEQNEVAAIVQYKRAAALNPEHAPSLLRLAALHEKKQPSAALEYINAYVCLEPWNVDAFLLRASLMSRLGDNQGAIRQYRELLDVNSENIAALSGAAACCQADNPAAAAEYYSQAIALKKGSPELHMGRAKAYMRLNRTAEAAEEYKTVIRLDKKIHEAYGRLAGLYSLTEPAEALEYIDKALALAPETPSYHAERAGLLLRAGKRAEAIEAFNKAVKYDPGNPSLHQELGILLKEEGNRASAVKNLEEAVNIDRHLAPSFRALAELYIYTEPDRALYYINTAIGLDMANADFYYEKSLIAARLGEDSLARDRLASSANEKLKNEGWDPDEMGSLVRGDCLRIALLYINRAIEIAPANNTYLCARAHIFYRMGQSSKALEQYKELLKSDGGNHEALFGLGVILLSKGDPKALEYFDRAIAVMPEAARYHEGKGDFLSGGVDTLAGAVECYDRALKLDKYNFEPALKKARLLLGDGNIFAAMDSYRLTLIMNPNCLEASVRMGELLADIQPDNARAYIEHAICLDPESVKAHMWRARILYSQNESEAASEQCREALEMCGNSARGSFELAEVLSGKFFAEALEHAVAATEKDGSKAEYHSLCGKMHLRLGDFDRAGVCFQNAIALDPKDLEAREWAVEYMYRKGLPEAVGAAEGLVESKRALLLKAKVFDAIADPPRTGEAIEVLTGAIKRYPEDIGLREELVALLKKKRALLRYPIEKSKLEKLRGRLKKARAKAAGAREIDFDGDDEREEAPDPLKEENTIGFDESAEAVPAGADRETPQI